MAFVMDDTIMHFYHRQAEETLTFRLPDFSRDCLHNTAVGKAYLSSLPDDLIADKIAALSLVAKTEKTIVDKQELIAVLQKAKELKYAMAEEEYLQGLIAIGAPLFDPLSGKGVGAVSFDFSILQHTAEEIRVKYADMIIDTAKSLSEILPPNKGRSI